MFSFSLFIAAQKVGQGIKTGAPTKKWSNSKSFILTNSTILLAAKKVGNLVKKRGAPVAKSGVAESESVAQGQVVGHDHDVASESFQATLRGGGVKNPNIILPSLPELKPPPSPTQSDGVSDHLHAKLHTNLEKGTIVMNKPDIIMTPIM